MRETRKKITLPSGGTLYVRRLGGIDAMSLKSIPPVFEDEEKARIKARRENKPQPARTPAEIDAMVQWNKIALVHATSPITFVEGGKTIKLKIVDKELDERADNEITIGELTDADAKAIIDGIGEISGLSKEAAEAVAPFSEEQSPNGEPSHDGENIREVANGNLEVVTS